MRPFFMAVFITLFSSCASVVPNSFTKENLSKPNHSVDELLEKLSQIKMTNYIGEKLIVQTIPYTWPVLVDRVYYHYVLEKEPGVKRLKQLFTKYRNKYKEEKCFFIQVTHSMASAVAYENWSPYLYVNDTQLGANYQLFLANKPSSLASEFDKRGDHPLLGEKNPTMNIDVCSKDLKEFAGNVKLVLSPAKGQAILPIEFNWNFAR